MAKGKKFDPYDELGLARDASPDDIKKAYRDRAKDSHPDHAGGSKEKFALVALAKDVLSDEKRRKKFDETGTVDEGGSDNIESQAFHIVMGVINGIIDGEPEIIDPVSQAKIEVDPLAQDIVGIVGMYLTAIIGEKMAQAAKIRKKLNRNERALKKFKRKTPGPNLIANALTTRSNAFRNAITDIENEIAKHKKAIEIIKTYEFEPDPVTMVMSNYTATTSSFFR